MFYFILVPLLIVSGLTSVLYVYISYNFDYWRKRKVPFIKPSFPFGNFGDVIMGRKSFIDLSIEQYRQFTRERFFGVFDFGTPVLVIKDPDLVEKVLISDFQIFCNKRFNSSSSNDEFLNKFLGGMQDKDWRDLRLKLNTAFSSNKIKQMFDNISLSADELVSKIKEYQYNGAEVPAVSISCLFSQRVIASSFFGFTCSNSFSDLLMNMSKKTLITINIVELIFLVGFYAPKLVNFLYYIPSVKKVLKVYKDLSSAAVKTRKENPVNRNDVLQILLDLKTSQENSLLSNKISRGHNSCMKCQIADDTSKVNTGVSDGFVTAQMFSFMCVGTGSLTTSLTALLTDLASNPLIQTKVQAEIDQVLVKYKKININSLQHLKYLDAVIQESLRMNPGSVGHLRTSSSPYTLPGTDLVLEAGTTVMIPTCAIQLDPNNYQDPQVFIPERFIDNNYKSSGAYMPFGTGPRMCLVYRLVILMLKVAVTKVLCEYSITLSPKSLLPLRYKPSFLGKLEDQLWLKFEPRVNSSKISMDD